MSFSQAQLDAIEAGIASGSTSVSYEGKSVSYRSLDDMLRIRSIIRRALGLDPSMSTTVLAAHDRGYPGAGGGNLDEAGGGLFEGF